MAEQQEVRWTGASHGVQVVRSGSGDPVVYLHGLSGVNPDDEVVATLAEHFEVVAPLHPGFADLEELDDVRDVHELALHYDSLLEALGLDRVRLVGHSYGGMVAAELAAHVPSRVSALLLVAPLGIWRDDIPAPDIFRAYPRHLDALLWSDGVRPEGLTSDTGDASDIDVMVSLAQGMTAVGKFMWPLPDKGLERRLHRIRARTTVLWGSDDRVVPRAYVDAFVAAIPDASLEVVDGGSHMLPVELPDAFAAAAAQVLGSR